MVGPTDSLVSELASIVGAEAVKSGDLDRLLYSKDAGVARGDVSVVVLPKTARLPRSSAPRWLMEWRLFRAAPEPA